ncbi:MAG: DUF5615 family PIN-like protein [Myxococcales bacterium]|nr:DUF5615 family PIN-like protein [Myxococcales bacterium]
MTPFDLPLLADENIALAVVERLRAGGLDLATVVELGLTGASDRVVLATAQAQGRVVLTHDSDLGMLAIRHGVRVPGIIYLRPGHTPPDRVWQVVVAVRASRADVPFEFVAVIDDRGESIQVRVRPLSPS